MKSIIFPTDFSDHSKAVFGYAKSLAEQLNARLKVVHIYHPQTTPTAGVILPNPEELLEIKQRRLARFLQEAGANTTCEQQVYLGYTGEELVRLSTEEKPDLIVMATSGEVNLVENMFGTISTYVSQYANCPVWLLPPEVRFSGINNIAYASNYESADEKSLTKLSNFANQFGAQVHLVHVNEDEKKGDVEFETLILKKLFHQKVSDQAFELATVESENVWEGLHDYARTQEIDLLVLLTRQRGFWEGIMHTSVTKKMVLQTAVPLLVLHLED
ncbi:MAG: universal stress protein [Saprospiraceae bacterium]